MADEIRQNTRPSASQANQLAASFVIIARAFSGPGLTNPWPLLVDAQAAGPTWIRDSERRAVHVPGAHVDGLSCQRRQRRRQGTHSEKGK
jgi:hypothetical protein